MRNVALFALLVACGDPKPPPDTKKPRPETPEADEAKDEPKRVAYYMVDGLVPKLGDLHAREMMVHGWVKAGSITSEIVGDERATKFQLTAKGQTVDVAFKGPVPDTFKDQAELVARGTLRGKTLFATELNTKCPSKYEGATSVGPTKFQ